MARALPRFGFLTSVRCDQMLRKPTEPLVPQATKLEPLSNRQGEVREQLSAAAAASRTAAMHRSDTGKKLARFFESILPRELPPLPPPAVLVYNQNGTMGLPSFQQQQQQQQFQDPQHAAQYAPQQNTGFTPSSGFDFSGGMSSIFDNNV